MELGQIAAFAGFALAYALLVPGQWRAWALLLASLLAMYALQPNLSVRWLDYSLPTATLALAVGGWWLTRSSGQGFSRQDSLALLLALGVVVLLALARYVDVPPALRLTSRPPELGGVLLALALVGGLAWTTWRLSQQRAWPILAALLALLLIFVVVKTPSLAQALAGLLRAQAGQDAALASALDIEWLGFSYVAFRLIHTLRDRQMGLLPALSLRDYLIFIIFFPAYTAGPIDRAERFQADMLALPALRGWDAARIAEGLGRIAVGLGKKFIIADSLALVALNSQNAAQAQGAGSLWLMLYAYALRLFFDFSGYSDIAIGIARLLGIQLPENFNRPYNAHTITLFWQRWHMSLSAWVRNYVFSPLTRALMRREPAPSGELVTLIGHLATMAIIGLWHGITLPFLIWGLWQGLGLWIHKTWSERTRQWYRKLKEQPARLRAWTFLGWALTFHYIVLGWAWFALPDADLALSVLLGLFGVVRG